MLVWRSRLHELGPRLVCCLLVALIGIDGARVIAVSRRENRPQPEPPPQRHSASPSPLDPQLIVAAHLFGVAEIPALDPVAVRPSLSDLRLHGTFATVDPRRGWAIIAADGGEKLYKIGVPAGGVALFSVYADHVLLESDGHLESLWLPHALRPARADSAGVGTGVATATDGAPRLADIMRVDAALDEESQTLIGFRIAPVAPASGLIKAGLRPYDVVTAVNGTAVADQDPQRSRQILDAALGSGSATLGILRGSVHLDVSVELPH